MPNYLKVALSVTIVAVALLFAWWQYVIGQPATPWVALGLGAFMIFAIWLFPEAKGGKK